MGLKLEDFKDFIRIAEIVKEKGHLNDKGLAEIQKIKVGMNKGRYEEILVATPINSKC